MRLGIRRPRPVLPPRRPCPIWGDGETLSHEDAPDHPGDEGSPCLSLEHSGDDAATVHWGSCGLQLCLALCCEVVSQSSGNDSVGVSSTGVGGEPVNENRGSWETPVTACESIVSGEFWGTSWAVSEWDIVVMVTACESIISVGLCSLSWSTRWWVALRAWGLFLLEQGVVQGQGFPAPSGFHLHHWHHSPWSCL